jgi:heme-degrading monooxygenase HmoA
MTDWPKTYYACIFTNQRSEQGRDLYPMMSDRMVELAKTQPGFLGVESVRGDDEIGITVSYWETREAIAAWGRHGEHMIAKRHGREEFYLWFQLRIAKVEETRSFNIDQLDEAVSGD